MLVIGFSLAFSLLVAGLIWAAGERTYAVYIRREWQAHRIGPFPQSRDDAEELAQAIVLAIQSALPDDPSEHAGEQDPECSRIILAGNSVSIAEDRLVSGGQHFSLHGVIGVRKAGSAPTGFYRLFAATIALCIVSAIVAVVITGLVGIFSTYWSGYVFAILAYFIGGMFFGGFIYGFTMLPPVWQVELQTAFGPICVYRTEDQRQAERVVANVRSALAQARHYL